MSLQLQARQSPNKDHTLTHTTHTASMCSCQATTPGFSGDTEYTEVFCITTPSYGIINLRYNGGG